MASAATTSLITSSSTLLSLVPAVVAHAVVGFFVYTAPPSDLSHTVMVSLPHVPRASIGIQEDQRATGTACHRSRA